MAKNKIPSITLKNFKVIDNDYDDGLNVYNVFKLIEHSKKFPIFDLPIAGIDLSRVPWGQRMSINRFCYHLKRINDSDLSYPILLDSDGYICDGWHRLCKAIMEGQLTIKAIRMDDMPSPDRESSSRD